MSAKPPTGDISGLTWVKSSHSTADGPDCVEVAAVLRTVHVRDSKHVPGPELGFTSTAWTDFVTYATGS
jgi:hypothetical protein